MTVLSGRLIIMMMIITSHSCSLFSAEAEVEERESREGWLEGMRRIDVVSSLWCWVFIYCISEIERDFVQQVKESLLPRVKWRPGRWKKERTDFSPWCLEDGVSGELFEQGIAEEEKISAPPPPSTFFPFQKLWYQQQSDTRAPQLLYLSPLQIAQISLHDHHHLPLILSFSPSVSFPAFCLLIVR